MTLQPFNIRGWKWLSAYRLFGATDLHPDQEYM